VLNFIVFDNFTWRGVGYINYKYQAIIKNKIIRETLAHVLSESHQFFQDNLSGRISNQITTLADNIELILHRISLEFIRGTSLLIVSFVTSFYVNPTFCYILVLWFSCFSTFSIWMSRRLVSLADRHAKSESLLSGQLVDDITNHNNIRIFSQKIFELVRMDRFFHILFKNFQAKERLILILCSVQGAMIAIMMGFAIYFLVHFYGLELVSIGDFSLILGLSMELGHMMWHTMSRVDDFNQAYGKCKQSLVSLMLCPEIQDKVDAKTLKCTQGKITFNNIRFHYKGSEPLFQNKSVTIESGQKIGLVGYSGSGKSTFVNLILRLYDVASGNILIDGQDIRDVIQDSLREAIAMIPQDPSLFHRSLMDNIRYGRTDALDEEVIEASQKAHAHEFIIKLPQGYNSLVGERGIKLSGGQRQRIAIARAILKNALILILDEATSQLDSVTESLIQESLWKLMQGKTTIVIAHRLSTLLHMDRILVFDKGKIVEDGTHSELLAKGGFYKTLWEAQVGGFLRDQKRDDEYQTL
jgi:ATP-binding cassette subfamily B protein